jgi:hypothetical protein
MHLRPLILIAAAAALLSAGCLAWFGGSSSVPKPRSFKHKLHLAKGISCDDCHPGIRKAGEPAVDIAYCRECHDKAPAGGAVDPVAEYVEPDGKTGRWRFYANATSEIKFSHPKHVAANVECATCHGKVADDDLSVSARAGKMDTCMSCHAAQPARSKAGGDCADCHLTIRRDQKPPSHSAGWQRSHGGLAGHDGPRGMEKEGRCSLCHEQSSCTACHQENPPRDHTAFWAKRGHGLAAASTDRGRCQTCHQQDFCVRCHETTTPSTHMAGWGTGRQMHCLTCHGMTAAENCSTCHRSAVSSHPSGPSRPASHGPTYTDAVCRTCHRSLAHADNGGACTSCHPK